MNKTVNRCVALLLISGSFLGGQPLAAQGSARNETVANRERPELDALGVRTGSFLLFPELAVGGAHNSNIYANDDFKIGDGIFVFSPGIEAKSDWNNHELNFGADADVFRYKNYDAENREDYSVWGEARLDTSQSRFFLGELSHERLHENRDSADDVRGFEPTRYYRNDFSISYEAPRAANRFNTRLTGEYRRLDFENAIGIDGIINNDDRDRKHLSASARVGYGFHPDYSLFIQGSAHSVDYDFQFDDKGFQRSSTGYELALGTTLDFSGETFGDIFVGYLSETYDDPRFDRIAGPSFGAEVFWNISGLTTLGVSGRREVEPTTVGETAGIDVTRFAIGVDHEFLRNLLLGLDLGTSKEDFKGTERQDDIRSANFSARYIMNRRMELIFEYSYRRRDSEPLGSQGIEFSRHVVSLAVKGQL